MATGEVVMVGMVPVPVIRVSIVDDIPIIIVRIMQQPVLPATVECLLPATAIVETVM